MVAVDVSRLPLQRSYITFRITVSVGSVMVSRIGYTKTVSVNWPAGMTKLSLIYGKSKDGVAVPWISKYTVKSLLASGLSNVKKAALQPS